MKVQTKRLFINNLPDNITQSDLEQKFAHYGTVASVEIKQRKNTRENQTPQFAYIQLDTENNNLQECINEFSNKKWKGHWIAVQEAKESFMERLKREREELKVNGTPETVTSIPVLPSEVNFESKTINVVNVRTYHSSSSESSSEDEQDSGFTSGGNIAGKGKPVVQQNGLSKSDDDQDELIIKNNRGAQIKGGLKIKSVAPSKKPASTEEKETKKLGAKESEADKKRLQSIAQMKKGYQQQKSLIKNALSNIDSKPKNKIVFGDDNAAIETPSKKARFEKQYDSTTAQHKSSNKQSKLTLFEDEENDDHEEEEYNFEVKEQFEGKKGQKLMQLQSKFKNDKRFAMDARFLENQSDEESEENEDMQGNEDNNIEISQEDEKQKQFEILEQVLGKKISRRTTEKETTESRWPKMMLRFDPTQPEHSKYEIKEPAKVEKAKKKRKDSEKETETIPVEAPKPEVSKDTFYKVAVDFKEALHEKEGFSLASMFSKEIQDEEQQEEEDNAKSQEPVKQKKKLNHEQNPFRYDSSSDDENDDDAKANETSTTANNAQQSSTAQLERTIPTRLWTESFFFKDDDYRLQAGFDFIKRLEGDDQGDFHQVRRGLRDIVRAKVRNNQRNNRPFKRKLGGKKRIKVKRAMKR